jgi:hypothetical protein
LRLLENEVPRGVFGPRKEEVGKNVKLCNFVYKTESDGPVF